MKKINFSINYSKIDIPSPIERTSSNDMVKWGSNNKYPYWLYNLYIDGSPTFQSCVNGVLDYITAEMVVDDKYIKYNDLKKVILDYTLLGCACLEVIRDYSNRISQLNYVNMLKVRTNKTNDVFFYRDWENSKDKEIIVPKFAPNENVARSFLFIKNPISKNIYGSPYYSSGIKSIVIDSEISNYHLAQLRNNFSNNTVLTFIGNPDQESVKEFERDFNDKFAGVDNAGKALVMWVDNKDDVPDIKKIESDDVDKKFLNLADKTMSDIFVAFRVTPNLLGMPSKTTGFNSQEFEQASKLFARTVVKPIQREIYDTLNNIIPNVVSFDEVEIEEE